MYWPHWYILLPVFCFQPITVWWAWTLFSDDSGFSPAATAAIYQQHMFLWTGRFHLHANPTISHRGFLFSIILHQAVGHPGTSCSRHHAVLLYAYTLRIVYSRLDNNWWISRQLDWQYWFGDQLSYLKLITGRRCIYSKRKRVLKEINLSLASDTKVTHAS